MIQPNRFFPVRFFIFFYDEDDDTDFYIYNRNSSLNINKKLRPQYI